jgi:hypothetical protein
MWQEFELWCQDKGLVIFQCSVRDIVCGGHPFDAAFLIQLFEQGREFPPLKVHGYLGGVCGN